MDNVMMVGLQQQRVLRRALEVVANNVANVSTTGFKADAMRFEMHLERPAGARDTPRDVRFVRDVGMVRDFAPGTLTRTGAPFDLAIQGEGFFSVQGPGGRTLLTRDGSFLLNAENELVTQSGMRVLDGNGQPIVFDPQGETPTIGGDGTVMLRGAPVATIGITTFADLSALQKVGENMLAAPAGLAPGGEPGRIQQGMLESSNVRPVAEMTRMIEVSRAYESVTRMLGNADDMRRRTIEVLGRASA
jgi:flagellar basal-body rod protein FlgF